MPGNTIGKLFTLTTFGESHGKCIGGVIDGCPPQLELDIVKIQYELERRKPKDAYSTPRKEEDSIEFLSGIFEGKTTGTPIAFLIPNKNTREEDYSILKEIFRPSHADFAYEKKYGIRDYKGGGRASARETAARVAGGAIAKQILSQKGICITAYVSQIGDIGLNKKYVEIELSDIDSFPFYFPDKEKTILIQEYLHKCKEEGDTTGGIISCIIKNCPAGLGEPVFDKLQADLAKAMLSINAVKGFEYGSGFASAAMKGSFHNDLFNSDFSTQTNHSGGIQGGISNGQDIYFNVAFKPIASLAKPVEAINKNGDREKILIGGRHDVCPVPRAVPIVEAMAALVLADHLLRYEAIKSR